jgi:outer membrane protein OmpA-like peptidoglycan-associated protein
VFTVNAKPNYDYVLVVDNGGDDVQEKAVTTEKIKEASLALGSFLVDKEPEPPVEKDPEPVTVVVYFGFNKASVSSVSKKLLDSIPALLAADTKLKLVIAAHTDLEGSNKYNDALSQKRADAVYAYLIEKGVPAEKINSSYFGETKPVELNRAWKLARKNRRVEITIAR